MYRTNQRFSFVGKIAMKHGQLRACMLHPRTNKKKLSEAEGVKTASREHPRELHNVGTRFYLKIAAITEKMLEDGLTEPKKTL
jgi:hypothetical protein